VPSCGSQKEGFNRQPAASSTLSGLETMQSGLIHVVKPSVQKICPQGAQGSRLVSARVVWSKPFDFFMRKAWSSPVALNFKTPQVNANWLQPIPDSPISTLLPTAQLAVLIWLHLDQSSLSCWSFGEEKLGLRWSPAAFGSPWRPCQGHETHSLCSL
jgi:hypothetical protein